MKEASTHQVQTPGEQVTPASEPQISLVVQKKSALGASPLVQRRGRSSEKLQESSLVSRVSQQQAPLQRKLNNTGLPDNLKSGVENLSGYSMDDVRVHYNSSKPAQLQAHAYAQGTDIHLGPGQEKHLPHEAWHVVQQKQGRVRPTMQMKGKVKVNDDAGLEREADVMGEKSQVSGRAKSQESLDFRPPFSQSQNSVAQRKVDLERYFGRDLSKETLARLQEIQELLADPDMMKVAMEELEKSTKELTSEGLSPTQALNVALQKSENLWMNPGRIKVAGKEIIRQAPKSARQKGSQTLFSSLGGGQMAPQAFVGQVLTPVTPLKDVGAGSHHGEYAHRLQWYAIQHHLGQRFSDERSEGDKGNELRHLYLMMSSPNRVIPHPLNQGLSDDSPDKMKDGKYPVSISLWDAVLDARGSWMTGMHGKDAKREGLESMYSDVGFASPPMLTAALANPAHVVDRYKDTPGYQNWAAELPTISEAVTHRKLKREGKFDAAKK